MIDSFLKRTTIDNIKVKEEKYIFNNSAKNIENDLSHICELNKEYMKGIYGLSTTIGATFNDMDVNALYLSRSLLEKRLNTKFYLNRSVHCKKYVEQGLSIYNNFINKNKSISEEDSILSIDNIYDKIEVFKHIKNNIGNFFEESYNIFVPINMANSEVYIEIPRFEHDFIYNKLGYSIETSMNGFSMKYTFFKAIMESIKLKQDNKKIVYFIPNMIMPIEVPFWKSFINELSKDSNSKIGIVIDNEAIVDYLESYLMVDYFIIDIDKLWLEFSGKRETNVDKKYFMEVLGDVLRDIHTILKLKNKKHIVFGEMLLKEDIFEKFFKMGFRSFIINKNQKNVFEKSMKSYSATRGKYKGVYAEKNNKKIINK